MLTLFIIFLHPIAGDFPPGGPVVGSSFQDEMSMSQAFMSRLQTSLNRSAGLPVGLVPRHSSLYSISLGIRPSSIRVTCPNHRKRLWEIKACRLGILPLARMS